jgi:hypothetical protein
MVKSKEIKGALRRGEMYAVALVGKVKERQMKVIDVDGKIRLKWIINSI